MKKRKQMTRKHIPESIEKLSSYRRIIDDVDAKKRPVTRSQSALASNGANNSNSFRTPTNVRKSLSRKRKPPVSANETDSGNSKKRCRAILSGRRDDTKIFSEIPSSTSSTSETPPTLDRRYPLRSRLRIETCRMAVSSWSLSVVSNLSTFPPEILARVFQYLNVGDLFRLRTCSRRLLESVDYHLSTVKRINFSHGMPFSYLPESITNDVLMGIFKKTPRVTHVLGCYPKFINNRQNNLSFDGILLAMKSLNDLKSIEIMSVKLLERGIGTMNKVKIHGMFRNRPDVWDEKTICEPFVHSSVNGSVALYKGSSKNSNQFVNVVPPNLSDVVNNGQFNTSVLSHLSNVTKLELVSCSLSAFAKLENLKYLSLRFVKFPSHHSIAAFSVPKLQVAIINNCTTMSHMQRMVRIMTETAKCPGLLRLEFVSSTFFEGLVENIATAEVDQQGIRSFSSLARLTLAGLRDLTRYDLICWLILCSRSLQNLSLDAALCSDNCFLSLLNARMYFDHLDSLTIGYEDPFRHRLSNRELSNTSLPAVVLSSRHLGLLPMNRAGSCSGIDNEDEFRFAIELPNDRQHLFNTLDTNRLPIPADIEGMMRKDAIRDTFSLYNVPPLEYCSTLTDRGVTAWMTMAPALNSLCIRNAPYIRYPHLWYPLRSASLREGLCHITHGYKNYNKDLHMDSLMRVPECRYDLPLCFQDLHRSHTSVKGLNGSNPLSMPAIRSLTLERCHGVRIQSFEAAMCNAIFFNVEMLVLRNMFPSYPASSQKFRYNPKLFCFNACDANSKIIKSFLSSAAHTNDPFWHFQMGIQGRQCDDPGKLGRYEASIYPTAFQSNSMLRHNLGMRIGRSVPTFTRQTELNLHVPQLSEAMDIFRGRIMQQPEHTFSHSFLSRCENHNPKCFTPPQFYLGDHFCATAMPEFDLAQINPRLEMLQKLIEEIKPYKRFNESVMFATAIENLKSCSNVKTNSKQHKSSCKDEVKSEFVSVGTQTCVCALINWSTVPKGVKGTYNVNQIHLHNESCPARHLAQLDRTHMAMPRVGTVGHIFRQRSEKPMQGCSSCIGSYISQRIFEHGIDCPRNHGPIRVRDFCSDTLDLYLHFPPTYQPLHLTNLSHLHTLHLENVGITHLWLDRMWKLKNLTLENCPNLQCISNSQWHQYPSNDLYASENSNLMMRGSAISWLPLRRVRIVRCPQFAFLHSLYVLTCLRRYQRSEPLFITYRPFGTYDRKMERMLVHGPGFLPGIPTQRVRNICHQQCSFLYSLDNLYLSRDHSVSLSERDMESRRSVMESFVRDGECLRAQRHNANMHNDKRGQSTIAWNTYDPSARIIYDGNSSFEAANPAGDLPGTAVNWRLGLHRYEGLDWDFISDHGLPWITVKSLDRSKSNDEYLHEATENSKMVFASKEAPQHYFRLRNTVQYFYAQKRDVIFPTPKNPRGSRGNSVHLHIQLRDVEQGTVQSSNNYTNDRHPLRDINAYNVNWPIPQIKCPTIDYSKSMGGSSLKVYANTPLLQRMANVVMAYRQMNHGDTIAECPISSTADFIPEEENESSMDVPYGIDAESDCQDASCSKVTTPTNSSCGESIADDGADIDTAFMDVDSDILRLNRKRTLVSQPANTTSLKRRCTNRQNESPIHELEPSS